MNDLIGIAVAVGVIVLLIMFLVNQQDKQKRNSAIICPNPNCGYRGPGKRVESFNGCFFLVLFFFFVVPGILYLLFCRNRHSVICPQCGCKIR